MAEKIILLADDDRDDTDLFCEALAGAANDIVCHCAGDGRELLNTLNELPEKPQLIFLDLNMPVMNGWECLSLLKQDPQTRHIPVIIISTSSHQQEMEKALSLGALCYFVKPDHFNQLSRVLGVLVKGLDTGISEAIASLQASESEHIFVCKSQ